MDNNAALNAFAKGDFDTSLALAELGLHHTPNDARLLAVRADSFVMQRRFDEAIPAYECLLQHYPDHVQSMVNVACIYRLQDRLLEAKRWLDHAASIDASFRDLVFARAMLHMDLGENDTAIQVLETLADDIDAKFLLSGLYLSNGDYERGFRLRRLRGHSVWAQPGLHPNTTPFDHWQEAAGKRIAVFYEGGLGDVIQFCRYIPLLAQVAETITYYVPPTAVRLLAQLPANVRVSSSFDAYDPSNYDFTTTDAEMPYHFQSTLETIPNEVPYLQVPPEVMLRRELPPTSMKRVGLCWAGGTADSQHARHYDVRRSFDLETYVPLAGVADVEFVSLQLGQRADQTCSNLPLTRVLDHTFDLLDTAAVVVQLDLVITVDTAIAHLAAAMGTRVWVLSRLDACWRWLRNHPTNPWYPGVLRVFGQTEYKDWSQPIADVTNMLREYVK